MDFSVRQRDSLETMKFFHRTMNNGLEICVLLGVIGIEMRETLEIVKRRCLGEVHHLTNKYRAVTLTGSASLQLALSPTRSKCNFAMASILVLPARVVQSGSSNFIDLI